MVDAFAPHDGGSLGRSQLRGWMNRWSDPERGYHEQQGWPWLATKGERRRAAGKLNLTVRRIHNVLGVRIGMGMLPTSRDIHVHREWQKIMERRRRRDRMATALNS